eukprot:snap_masked-scaffold_11-processed-gene-12.47-mRNA-1 protein AED:0.00 eAED:0.00 QI:0/-1/0/1/-1/1/1/0/459
MVERKNSGQKPLVIALCGMPARGKSYLSKKLSTYLTWIGIKVKVFNAGAYRRKLEGAGQTADYYDFGNEKARQEREEIAKTCFTDLLNWLKTEGEVALFDATNTTQFRRRKILEWSSSNGYVPVLFLESICTDEDILEKNYRLKLHNEDYKGKDREVALADFKKRVAKYQAIYETIGETPEEENYSYIKVYNVGRKVIINNCFGWLQSQVVSILQNFHISPRRILLSRHGESISCLDNVIGRDADLTDQGQKFSEKLLKFMKSLHKISFDSEVEEDIDETNLFLESKVQLEPASPKSLSGDEAVSSSFQKVILYSSVLKRATETIEPIAKITATNVIYTTALNELNGGLFEGLTRRQLQVDFPEEYYERQGNKAFYRYPGGESYMDVVQRLQPIVLDLERAKEDVLIVSHTAPIRALLGYFLGKSVEEMVHFELPDQTVFEIQPCPFDCKLIAHDLSRD